MLYYFEKQPRLVFAIPGTDPTMDVCIRPIPNTLFHVVVCPYQMPKNRGNPLSGNKGCSLIAFKRIRLPDDKEPNKTSRIITMKATYWVQSAFLKNVRYRTVVIQVMSNTFFEERNDILVLRG